MKYAQAFEIARCAAEHERKRGLLFRDGVEREAALAAVPHAGVEAVCTAIESVFAGHRISLNPAWDGSVA